MQNSLIPPPENQVERTDLHCQPEMIIPESSACGATYRHSLLPRGNVSGLLQEQVASVCLVPLCYRRSENNPIFSSKWPEKPKGRSLSIAKYKQAGSLSVGKAGTEYPWSFLGFVCYTSLVSVCLCVRFYPSSPFHLHVLSFHANCYSVFHFCGMSVRYLSVFELVVVTHY